MQARRILGTLAMLFASACSGASSTELFDPTTQGSNGTEPVSGSNDDPVVGSSGGTSSGDGTSGSGGSSGAQPGPGPSPDAGPPPPPPPPACVAETEPNDGPELSEWFTECFGGTVKKGDIDYASISAPAGATKVSITHTETGDVRYRLYINGVPVDTFSDDAPQFIPMFAGGTYAFEMSPMGSSPAARTYELKVTFE